MRTCAISGITYVGSHGWDQSARFQFDIIIFFAMKIGEGLRKLHGCIVHALLQIAHAAATRPKLVLCVVPILSISIFVTGVKTNFYMETNEVNLWTPATSQSIKHGDWLEKESGLSSERSQLQILIHNNGENVLGRQGIDYAFRALNTARSVRSYSKTFSIMGIVNFFEDDYDLFQRTILNDDDAIKAVSTLPYLPNGDIVNRKEMFGFAVENLDGTLRSAKSYMIKIDFPISNNDTNAFEREAVGALLLLKREWSLHIAPYRLEILSSNSYTNEFQESVKQDIGLLPIVFVVMTTFSALVFYRGDSVRSSCLCLGIGAVVTVVLSILTSFGLLFIMGVPFNNLAFMLPFIILGIGLDDSYIIMGSYERIHELPEAAERISLSIKDCGLSIFVTTLTTSFAFCLGLISNIPAVKDFSIYASVCVAIDFLYQLTFFIALIIINNKRIQNGRYDFLPCVKRRGNERRHGAEQVTESRPLNVAIMSWYAKSLINLSKPYKLTIIIGFFALSVFCLISSLQLEVSFDFTEMVPANSYVKSFVQALEKHYQSDPYNCLVVFRDVDFSDPGIQMEMHDYINDLVNLEFVSSDQPQNFWLNDFQAFITQKDLGSIDFNAQLNAFLGVEWYSKLYSHMIGFSEEGEMISSSLILSLDIDMSNTIEQIQFLSSQEEITTTQLINKDSNEWKFFTFSASYFMWDFFRVTTHELIMNTILGLVAVFFTTVIFVQHPAGSLFVTVTVALIYVDVLGLVKIVGMYINPVTYVSIILSIGLMVDYVVHVMLKYFESDATTSEGRVFDCLSTMGSSVVIGGLSTILGTIPLVFSSSEIFHAVLIIFLSFVILSLVHGLLFLPIILITIDPLGNESIVQVQEIDETSKSEGIDNEATRDRKNTSQDSSDFSSSNN